LYKDIQKRYIKEYVWNNPTTPTFIQLLTSDNWELHINIAIVVQKRLNPANLRQSVTLTKYELLNLYVNTHMYFIVYLNNSLLN